MARFSVRGAIFAAMLAAVLAGCTSHPKRAVNFEPVTLEHAKTEIPDSQLLGVRIAVFDPGELPPSDDESSGLSMEIRKAEARYAAAYLKNVMQQTGMWGPVRVVPSDSDHAEVMVNGRIIESDGEVLKLEVAVRDASGAHWFTKEYEGVVDLALIERAGKNRSEPFRFVYIRIANDIAAHRGTMSAKAIEGVRQVAELRFAADFAPNAFAGYLAKPGDTNPSDSPIQIGMIQPESSPGDEQPQYRVRRLPAEDDPVMMRLRRLQARDEMLVDTIDMQYDGLYRRLDGPYREWRRSRVVEIEAIRQLESERNAEVAKGVALFLGAILFATVGGGDSNPGLVGAMGAIGVQTAMQAAKQASNDTKIHEAGLTELGESFSADAEPIVIEVEGETVRLTGTAQQKYEQWRKVLEKLRQRESGADMTTISADGSDPVDAPRPPDRLDSADPMAPGTN